MSIYQTDLITVNGSQRFLGGVVYNASYTQGFNGDYSTLDLDIVSETRNYQNPNLSFKVPYNIKLGNNINLTMYAYKYCIDDGQNGKILRVSFRDGIDKLKTWLIGLKSIFTGQSFPNVILLGNTTDDLIKNGLPLSQFDHYSYQQFQEKTAFLGIPNIPSNNYMTTNLQQNVIEVFNYFMQAYGYSWYLGTDNIIHLIDIKKPIVINPTVLNNFETHTKKLNSQNCFDIGNNKARCALALSENDDSIGILSFARPLWEGTFLGIPFKIKDLNSCIAATLGIKVYFAYMVLKYGWAEALNSIGYKIKDAARFDTSKAELFLYKAQRDKTNLFSNEKGANGTGPNKQNFCALVYQEYENNDEVPFYIAEKIGNVLRKKLYTVSNGFSNLDISWNVGSSQLLDPTTKMSELPEGISDILDFSKVTSMGGNTTPDSVTIGDFTSTDTYLLTFADSNVENKTRLAVKPNSGVSNFISIGQNPPNLIKITDTLQPATVAIGAYSPGTTSLGGNQAPPNIFIGGSPLSEEQKRAIQAGLIAALKLFPNTLDIPASTFDPKYDDSTYKICILNDTSVNTSVVQIPDFSAVRRSIKGTGSTKASLQNSVYGINNKIVVGKVLPNISDLTSEIELVIYENLSLQDVDASQYLQQVAVNRNQIDQHYSCTIRGISLGFNVTPLDGLNNISISLDSNGYTSVYSLSTRQPEPAAIETFKQKFPIN